jgi:hypothetical protein
MAPKNKLLKCLVITICELERKVSEQAPQSIAPEIKANSKVTKN